MLDEEEAHSHFGFSRIVVNPDYPKHPKCLLELFLLEHYDDPGNSSSDFIRLGVCHRLFGSKNKRPKIAVVIKGSFTNY